MATDRPMTHEDVNFLREQAQQETTRLFQEWHAFTRLNDDTGEPISFVEWRRTASLWSDVTTPADPPNVRRFKRIGQSAGDPLRG